jgi:hypothetical protein
MTKTWDLDYFKYHEEWIDYTVKKLGDRESATAFNMSTGITSQLHRTDLPPGSIDLIEEVTELVGGLEFNQLRGVLLPKNNIVKPHEHISMVVVLYMPMTHTCTLEFIDPPESIETVEGRAVEVAQGRRHWVSKNQNVERRVTMAVMFTAPTSA